MIDFRYHIVSLIAVFMALAVGIVIGAGPLRDYLADELSGQVEQLRVEKEEMRVELEESEAASARMSQFVAGAAPGLLSEVLTDRGVAIVQLPEADAESVEAVIERLEQSGATVTGQTALTEVWLDPGQRAFRSGIGGNIAAYLNPQPEDDAASERVLGTALGQALTLRDPDNLSASSTEAQAMYDLLISSELIEEITEPSGPAYATVVIGGTEPPEDLEAAEEMNTILVAALDGLAETGEGNVLAAGADDDGELLAAVRANEGLTERLSTVDSVDMVTGQVTVPLALAADIADTSGAFGVAESAAAAVPNQVSLAPPDPEEFAPGSPDAPPEEDEDGTEDEEGTTGTDGEDDEATEDGTADGQRQEAPDAGDQG